MQWLGLYFPNLPLDLFWAGEKEQPVAVTRRHQGREIIDRCNIPARQQGLHPGMVLNAALVLVPGLCLHERDRKREQRQLEAIAAWAWRYSSRISLDPLLLLLEVGGSARLFGGRDALLEQLREDPLAPAALEYQALAPSPGAAALLARVRPGCRVETFRELRQTLETIPLAQLTRNARLLDLMRGIGLSRIGDALSLPRPELARRVGPEPALLLDRLLGRAPDPRPLWQPPEHFRQSLLLLAEIEQAPALQFPARRLVAALSAFLRGRDAATQKLRWRFLHRNAPSSLLEQGMLAPTNDSDHILELFRQHLEHLQLPEAVVEMVLEVDTWQAADKTHGDLFSAPREGEQGFLERLCARLGTSAVRGLQGQPDHRPEKSWAYREPVVGAGSRESLDVAAKEAPLWLLPQSRRLPLRNGQPWHEGRLELRAFSRRIETGWWDDGDIARDYYRATNPAGQQLWVYRDRRNGHWYLQGVFE
ncbi:Y-family DNA polymerase [Thiolapillus brandeum]|uniref:UmuC domain-containing protein n=1 Tax=Thiolapillus brandeum TaxID=1076588 RepID=A0A7U6GHI6_9GAMM|nr:DNA polymerase Y family protein [Thiolapillus brandeum]BAO43727.1 conserved hypothetical protein [Thiolapillus brandeum]